MSFFCEFCKEKCSLDSYDQVDLKIDGFGTMTFCEDCTSKATSLLIPKNVQWTILIKDHNTDKKFAVTGYEELKEWIKDKDIRSFQFGLVKEERWPEAIVKSWLGEGDCGGLTDEQILKTVEYLNEINPSETSLIANWKGAKSLVHRAFSTISPLDFLKDLKTYEKDNGLEGKPVMIACPQAVGITGVVADNHQLRLFCEPEDCMELLWFDDPEDYNEDNVVIKEIHEILTNPDEIADVQGIEWEVTKEFLERQEEDLDKAQEKIVKKRKIINELYKQHKIPRPDPLSTA